jgi:hypothetical protein
MEIGLKFLFFVCGVLIGVYGPFFYRRFFWLFAFFTGMGVGYIFFLPLLNHLNIHFSHSPLSILLILCLSGLVLGFLLNYLKRYMLALLLFFIGFFIYLCGFLNFQIPKSFKDIVELLTQVGKMLKEKPVYLLPGIVLGLVTALFSSFVENVAVALFSAFLGEELCLKVGLEIYNPFLAIGLITIFFLTNFLTFRKPESKEGTMDEIGKKSVKTSAILAIIFIIIGVIAFIYKYKWIPTTASPISPEKKFIPAKSTEEVYPVSSQNIKYEKEATSLPLQIIREKNLILPAAEFCFKYNVEEGILERFILPADSVYKLAKWLYKSPEEVIEAVGTKHLIKGQIMRIYLHPSQVKIHYVKRGENIEQIMKKYNLTDKIAFCSLNCIRIKNPKIKEGDALLIITPPSSTTSKKISPGCKKFDVYPTLIGNTKVYIKIVSDKITVDEILKIAGIPFSTFKEENSKCYPNLKTEKAYFVKDDVIAIPLAGKQIEIKNITETTSIENLATTYGISAKLLKLINCIPDDITHISKGNKVIILR